MDPSHLCIGCYALSPTSGHPACSFISSHLHHPTFPCQWLVPKDIQTCSSIFHLKDLFKKYVMPPSYCPIALLSFKQISNIFCTHYHHFLFSNSLLNPLCWNRFPVTYLHITKSSQQFSFHSSLGFWDTTGCVSLAQRHFFSSSFVHSSFCFPPRNVGPPRTSVTFLPLLSLSYFF